MKKQLALAAILASVSTSAFAQSVPNGGIPSSGLTVWTITQWINAWASKQDTLSSLAGIPTAPTNADGVLVSRSGTIYTGVPSQIVAAGGGAPPTPRGASCRSRPPRH